MYLQTALFPNDRSECSGMVGSTYVPLYPFSCPLHCWQHGVLFLLPFSSGDEGLLLRLRWLFVSALDSKGSFVSFFSFEMKNISVFPIYLPAGTRSSLFSINFSPSLSHLIPSDFFSQIQKVQWQLFLDSFRHSQILKSVNSFEIWSNLAHISTICYSR